MQFPQIEISFFSKKDLTFQKVSAIIIASKAFEQEQVSFFGTSRELPVGARQQRNIRYEVHSASSVLKIAVDTTGATVTSLRLLSLLRFRP